MTWLGLSPLQMVAVWFAAAALATWLYIQTRRLQRRRVSSLRFWLSIQPGAEARRRRLLEPWALLAQLLFLLFVIIALGNPRWGETPEARRVVMVLDNSVWSQVRVPRETPWIEQIRRQAQSVLDGLPLSDPVLLLSTEPDAPPIQRFTTDRTALRQAIAGLQASSFVANIPRVLETGKGALAGLGRGLLVYVGPGKFDESQALEFDGFRQRTETAANAKDQPQFLVRLAGGSEPAQNRGITRLSVQRDPAEPDLWHLLTQIKNYDATPANVMLKLTVGGQSIGEQKLSLAAGELANAENQFMWAQDGTVQAEIATPDALDADNHASINLPAFAPARVALIGTDSPFASDIFTAVSSDPYLQTEIVRPGASPRNAPDVAIYESANPPGRLTFNSVWFLKGKGSSDPRPLRISGWNSNHPVTRWVRSRDISVRNPAALRVLPGDTVLATVEGNPPAPIILAREQNGHRLVIIGFDPDDSNFARQSAFLLVMAGSIEWMSHSVNEAADSFSVGEMDMPGPASRIIAPSGKDVPFAPAGSRVHLLAAEAGTYRVVTPNGEMGVPVNLPLLPARSLQTTSAETATVQSEPRLQTRLDIWRWLAVLAVIALWLEWWLYYSTRRKREISETLQLSNGDVSTNLDSDSVRNPEQSEDRSRDLVV